ncbi:hypothetical protein SO802_015251 [Lithocarpus litseifolius]|uniref:Uncharacterized protein n=1 Tax=Lithocarpus litseifolius TaxID=425828 RepID=A0AAW2CT56_9ROSI
MTAQSSWRNDVVGHGHTWQYWTSLHPFHPRFKGIRDGSVATQHNDVPRKGPDEGDVEVDRMEFEGGGEIYGAF